MEKLKAYCNSAIAIAKTKGSNCMKKTLPILFSLALICCAFTACGDSEKNNDNKNATESPTTVQNEDSNSATENSTDTKDNDNADNNGGGIVDNIVTDTEGIVDDLVSTGEDIVDDAGSVVEGVGDAIAGTDEQS